MLLVAATPIGNLDDHSPRLIEALRSADLIVAEDTRTTGQLMRLLGVDTPAVIMALHEHNELDVTEKVLSEAARGQVVLVSDAGMPGLSDPGFPIVRAAHAKAIPVSVLPGPSAITAALAVSGMPTDRFCFEGLYSQKGDATSFFGNEQASGEPWCFLNPLTDSTSRFWTWRRCLAVIARRPSAGSCQRNLSR